MKTLRTIVDAVIALFILDGILTFAILGVVAATAILLKANPSNFLAELFLVAGVLQRSENLVAWQLEGLPSVDPLRSLHQPPP